APGTLVKLPVAGTTMPASAPNKTNLIVKPGTAPAPGPTPALPAQPARTTAPGTLPSPAGGLANTAGKSGLPGGFTTVSPTMSASNPAFIGPPAPPALLAKNAAAAAAIAAARPNHAGAVAASTQPM